MRSSNTISCPYWCDWYFGDIIINQQAWAGLPQDLQDILKTAMTNYGEKNKEVYSKEVEIVKSQASELGYRGHHHAGRG